MAKIAIIEDDPPIRQMYEMKFQAQGYEVKSAEDGEQGLKLIESFKPDLVLLDLRMPIMDGKTMLKKLREKEWGQHTLVIILTNVSQDEAPMELRHMRIEKYIVKAHHTPKQVVDIVSETLGRYKNIAQL